LGDSERLVLGQHFSGVKRWGEKAPNEQEKGFAFLNLNREVKKEPRDHLCGDNKKTWWAKTNHRGKLLVVPEKQVGRTKKTKRKEEPALGKDGDQPFQQVFSRRTSFYRN